MDGKDTVNTAALPNIKVLRSFRLNGEHLPVGTVVSKDDFPNAGDWAELCTMTPQSATQTDDDVRREPTPRELAGKSDRNAKSATTKMP